MATRNNHALQLTIFTTLGGFIITALGLLWPKVAPLPPANVALDFAPPLNLGGFVPEPPPALAAMGLVLSPSLQPTDSRTDGPGEAAIAALPYRESGDRISIAPPPIAPPAETVLALASSASGTIDRTATPFIRFAQVSSAPTLSPPRPESPPSLATAAPPSRPDGAANPAPPYNMAQNGSYVATADTWAEHYQDWIWGVGGVIFALVVWLGLYISRLQDQLRQLRRQMNDRQDAFVQLHHQLQEATQEAEIHQSLVATLQEQLDHTQTNYHHSQDQCQTLTEQIAALQTRLQERRNEVAYVHLLEEENQALNQTQQELSELQSQLERQQEKVMVLAAERDSLSQQLSQVSHKLQYCEVQQITHEDLPPLDAELQHTLRIDCAKDLGKLPMKEFRQLMQRIVELQTTPRPHDSRPLNKYGLRDVLSVDAGEYRICYRIQEDPEHHLAQIQVLMVDKRNDGTVYNRLRRALG